jgi:hypothetical protein
MNKTIIDYTNFESHLSNVSIDYIDSINKISAIKKILEFINEYGEEKFLYHADKIHVNDLETLIHFIMKYGENNLMPYFSIYKDEIINLSFNILDTFISEYGLEYIGDCNRLYQGKYTDEVEFAEQYLREDVDSLYHYANEYLHYHLDIDINWKDTADSLFNEHFVFLNGYVFGDDC